MAQQCPNCGGYRIQMQPKPERNDLGAWLFSITGTFIFVVMCLMLFTMVSAGGLPVSIEGLTSLPNSVKESVKENKGVLVPLLCLPAWAILGVISLINLLNAYDPNLWECELCGYKWDPNTRFQPTRFARLRSLRGG
jgi:hypothetical protein